MGKNKSITPTVIISISSVAIIASLLFTAIHEGIHFLINFIFTGGTWGDCGNGLPFTVRSGIRPVTCYESAGKPYLNNLLTPYITSSVAIVFIHYSSTIKRRYLSIGVFIGAVATWIGESLYGMGWIAFPQLTKEGVKYTGDGMTALAEFGYVSQIPGMVTLAVGALVVARKISIN